MDFSTKHSVFGLSFLIEFGIRLELLFGLELNIFMKDFEPELDLYIQYPVIRVGIYGYKHCTETKGYDDIPKGLLFVSTYIRINPYLHSLIGLGHKPGFKID